MTRTELIDRITEAARRRDARPRTRDLPRPMGLDEYRRHLESMTWTGLRSEARALRVRIP